MDQIGIDQTADPVRFEELWGAGFFAGRTYPVPTGVGVFVGGRRTEMAAGRQPFVAGVRSSSTRVPDSIDDALEATRSSTGYLWSMEDRRAATWTVGRVALLSGDLQSVSCRPQGSGQPWRRSSARR